MKNQLIFIALTTFSFSISAMEQSASRSQPPHSSTSQSTSSSPKSARRSPSPSAIPESKFGPCIEKIYRELCTIEEELNYLFKRMHAVPSQNKIIEITGNPHENGNPISLTLCCIKKMGWIPVVFCQSSITLSSTSCSSLEEFKTLKKYTYVYFSLCKAIIENQMQASKSKKKPFDKLMESLSNQHNKIKTLIASQKEYWRCNPELPGFKTIEHIHKQWQKNSIVKSLQNTLGREIFDALPDRALSQFKAICAQALLNPECFEQAKKALFQRLSKLSNTKMGKPFFANDKTNCVDHLLGNKAFKQKNQIEMDTQLLILTHCSAEFIKKNAKKLPEILRKLEQLSPTPGRRNTIKLLTDQLEALETKQA